MEQIIRDLHRGVDSCQEIIAAFFALWYSFPLTLREKYSNTSLEISHNECHDIKSFFALEDPIFFTDSIDSDPEDIFSSFMEANLNIQSGP